VSLGTILLLTLIVFVVLGPEKVPEVGRALGRALREFRRAMAEFERSVDEQAEPVRKAITDAQQTADTHAAEISKAAAIPDTEPVKKSQESQKSE
jgi:TatA/E family protein of Tat protein translocase